MINSIESVDSRNFMRQLMEKFPFNKIKDSRKLAILKSYFAEIDFRISQGADDKVQLIALLSEMINSLI